MTIRAAAANDLSAIIALERACPTAAHWNHAEYERIVQSGSPRFAIVAIEAALVGFIVAGTAGPEWEIENVVVAPAHRGLGIGLALVNAVLDRARAARADAVVLEVRASNAAARALYSRAGFAEIGARPRYYSHPEEDAVLLSVKAFPAQPGTRN